MTEAPADDGPEAAHGAEDIAALARLVKYCEDEASGLKLPFVAYCLSIANNALAEEAGSADSLPLVEEG